MQHELEPTRRDAIRSLARVGVASLGLAAVLGGCETQAQRRVKTRGGHIGDPIPEDPIVLREPWSPSHGGSRPTTPGHAGSDPVAGSIPRQQWTRSGPVIARAQPMSSIRRITIHHDAMELSPSAGHGEVAQRLEAIRRYHVNHHQWADIGYHYAIDPAGRVWQGRPMSLQGAHVKEHNHANLGVMLMGNFERQRPTPAAIETLDRLVAAEMRRFSVPITEVRTHREFSPTACPGLNLQREMDRTRTIGGRLASLAAGSHRG